MPERLKNRTLNHVRVPVSDPELPIASQLLRPRVGFDRGSDELHVFFSPCLSLFFFDLRRLSSSVDLLAIIALPCRLVFQAGL